MRRQEREKTLLQEIREKQRAAAGEEGTERMQAVGVGKRAGLGPSLSSHPLPRRQTRSLSTATVEKFPVPSLPDTWVPCSR